MYKCIDLSEFQDHGHDFTAIKNEGVDACIVRVGEIFEGNITADPYFDENIDGAINAGIHAGGYYCSGAGSIDEAYAEANFVVSKLQGKNITMPVYVDLEENIQWLKENVNDVIQVYYNVLTNAGYLPGVYSYYEWYNNYIDLERWKNISLWIAQNPVMTMDPVYFGMWQWGSSDINGMAKNPVDTNELYVAYWDQLPGASAPAPAEPVMKETVIKAQSNENSKKVGKDMKPQLDVVYSAHSQNIGWGPEYRNGQTAGTVHQCIRLEAIKVAIDAPGKDINVFERAHVQNKGWLEPVYNGAICGTVGEGLELQACQFQLTGKDAEDYSIWYQLQVQNYGWMAWAKDGALTGTVGKNLQAEAIRVLVLDSSVDLTSESETVFIESVPEVPVVPEPAPDQPQEATPVQSIDMITAHFARDEYKCDCGGRFCDGFPVPISQDLANGIEQIRLALNVPVHISSGVRCTERNAEVGGIPNSKHTQGLASDVWIDGMSHDVVDLIADTAESIGLKTIRYYDQLFVHCEI